MKPGNINVEELYQQRYDILPIQQQTEIRESWWEPYKVRYKTEKERELLLKDRPKWNIHGLRNGSPQREEIGKWIVLQPRNDEFDKIEAFARIEAESKKLARLSNLQQELRKVDLSHQQIVEIKERIDSVFKELFGYPPIEEKMSDSSGHSPDIEAPDLSNTKGTEKIIYLHELRILDFLKEREPFNLSTRQLAIVLSAITGEKTDTLVSYLNPIYSPGADQKNNPLEKPNKVEKVRAILAEIGYKPK